MENTINYQFSYPAPRLTSQTSKADGPTFASEDGLVASLSSQECIFQVKRTGAPHVMTFQVLQAMDQCREFRTLDEHAARIQSSIPALAGKQEDVKRVLEGLVQRQLLVSDRDFVTRLGEAAPRAPAPMRAVFIRAGDRPEQLGQLLNSLVEYERIHRGGQRYVVIDDSVLTASVNEQRDLLREFARTTGCKVHYIGQAERAKIVDRFAKAVPQAAAVAAKLLMREASPHAPRSGRGRGLNLALLLSAGGRFVLLDDSSRLHLKRPPFAQSGLDPNPSAQALARFLPNLEEAIAFGEEVATDPFELHLKACGQSLGSLSTNGYALSQSALRGMNLSRLDLLVGSSRIVASHCASYGHARHESSQWMYQLEATSRADFWQDRASYLRNVGGQAAVWFGVGQARVGMMSRFTPFAIDNSSMLPFTNPVGTEESGVFTALTRFCHSDALVLDLPEGLGHFNPGARKPGDSPLEAFVPNVNQFLREFVERHFGLFKGAEPGQRLRLMGAVLRDIAEASEPDRIAHLRDYLSFARADLIDRLQHQFEAAAQAPIYWQADVRSVVEANAKALLGGAPPRLKEWPDEVDPSGCATRLSLETREIAEACDQWPALWSHASAQGDKLLGAL